MRYKLLLLFICIILLSGCVTNGQPLQQSAYQNNVYGYEIMKPAGWQVAEPPQKNPVTFSGNYEHFAAIVIEVKETTDNLNMFFQKERDRIDKSTMYVGTVFQPEAQTTVNQYDAISLDYTYTMGVDMKAREYFIVKNGKAYMIIYQAKTEHFNAYLADAEESINTFELI